MKKALFYSFLLTSIGTVIVTLLGISNVVKIKNDYFKPLFFLVIIQLAGVVIALYKSGDLLSEHPNKDLHKYRPSKDAGRVLATLWTFQMSQWRFDKSKVWGMALPPDKAQFPTFYRGIADLIEVGLVDIDHTDRMVHLTTEGIEYCQRNAAILKRYQMFTF